MIKNKIKTLIEDNIKTEIIVITDLTNQHKNHIGYDGGGHYKLLVVSDDFINLSLIERHKIIYKILDKMIKNEIHALSINAKTIQEYNTL